jgi:hypothetical protein
MRGTSCPHSVFMCFVWMWEQTAIISLYSINWLVFITETECVYCAVRAESLNIIQVDLSLLVVLWLKLLVAGLSPRRPGFDPWSVHVRFVFDRVQIFSQYFKVSLSVSFYHCSILIYLFTRRPYKEDKRAKSGSSPKSCALLYIAGALKGKCFHSPPPDGARGGCNSVIFGTQTKAMCSCAQEELDTKTDWLLVVMWLWY